METREAILEGLKEVARVMILAAIPIVIKGLENGLIDWKLIGVAAIIAGLKFVDKFLHKSDIPVRGLLPF